MTEQPDATPTPDTGPEGTRGRLRPRLPKTVEGTLSSALLVSAGLNGLFGLLMLIFPRFVWDTVGGAGDILGPAYDSMRFAGGVLVVLAIGALLVLGRPEGQNSLVTVLALEKTLIAAAFIINVAADEAPTDLWFELVVAIGSTVVAAYLWWARIRSRKLLQP